MNSSTLAVIGNAINNVTTSGACNSTNSLTESIYLILNKIVLILTTSGQYGFWKFCIILFAIIGFFSVLSAIGGKLIGGVMFLIKVFVYIPTIFILSIINKKKRKERLQEWGEIKKQIKGKKSWKFWVYLFLKIGIPLLMLAIIYFT